MSAAQAEAVEARTVNGLDLFLIVLVVVGGYLIWRHLDELDRERAERDEQLREWLAGGRRR